MIYVDTSVLLAEVLREKRRPKLSFWANQLTSSRLLEYEALVRLHALRRPAKMIATAQQFIAPIMLAELDSATLTRALQPFPGSVRTLDAIHLSTIVFLQDRGIGIELASYDTRLVQAAVAMGITLAPI